ncbi:MAG: DUF1648 domain-containing protein [Ligilactobacillus salivarius]|nr:DUF1648 domain-containing protein [Ligilactobacillus salivarius]
MKVIKNNMWFIILILIVLISITVYGILPTRLPVHFTLTGTVDGTDLNWRVSVLCRLWN